MKCTLPLSKIQRKGNLDTTRKHSYYLYQVVLSALSQKIYTHIIVYQIKGVFGGELKFFAFNKNLN